MMRHRTKRAREMRRAFKILRKNEKKRGYWQDVTSMGKILKYISRKFVGIRLRIEIKD